MPVIFLRTDFSDDLVYYNFMETSATCDFSTVRLTDFVVLDTCTALDRFGGEQDVILLSRVPKREKTGMIATFIQGFEIDCSPTNGIHMMAISTGGNRTHCKAHVGHSTGLGIVTCTYFCRCSPSCAMFRVTIADLADKLICAFEV